jgi:hypothetical protein
MFEGSYDRDVCQFCNQDNGYLVEFARGWICQNCWHEYGVPEGQINRKNVIKNGRNIKNEHEYYYDEYGNKKSYEGDSLKNVNKYYYGENGEDYASWWVDIEIKPIKVPVIIEELVCDPKNLAHGVSYKYTLIPTKTELKSSGRKWQVEIFD